MIKRGSTIETGLFIGVLLLGFLLTFAFASLLRAGDRDPDLDAHGNNAYVSATAMLSDFEQPFTLVLDASKGETGCGWAGAWDADAQACVVTVHVQALGANPRIPRPKTLLRVQVGDETIERDITHLWATAKP